MSTDHKNKSIVSDMVNSKGEVVSFTLTERDGKLILQTSNGHLEIVPVNTNELWIEIKK